MKSNKEKQCGIYIIKNLVNNKVYIGKSKNIVRRFYQHKYDLKNNNFRKENEYFINAYNKYGKENFKYEILELLPLDENLVAERELYWVEKYNSDNRLYGYNLRKDSSTKMIVHPETSLKISNRLKKEWSSGIRKNHSKKLANNWKLTPDRNKIQSDIMRNNLTKYSYNLYTLDDIFIENCDYKKLKDLGLKGFISALYQYKIRNKIITKLKYKNYIIEKIKIEDIVRSSEKSEKNKQ